MAFGSLKKAVDNIPEPDTISTIVIEGTGNRPTSFSLSSFKTKLVPVRPNLFDAEITNFPQFDNINMDRFKFRVESAEFPGKTISTVDSIGSGGHALRLPSEINYNDISLTILCSEDMIERQFFESWIDTIIGTNQYTTSGNRQGRHGLLRYYADYAQGVELTITQYNSNADPVYAYFINHVYPISLSQMTASWEESNTYQRFQVVLNYRYHEFVRYKF